MTAQDINTLVLRLLGPASVCVRGSAIEPSNRKALWLLALLALRSGLQTDRRWVANLFWPDSPDHQSLYNLRRCLSALRSMLGPEAERIQSPTPRTIALNLKDALVDVLVFDAACRRGEPADLEEAIDLYRGPVLAECHDDWALEERESREQAWLSALDRLASWALESGDEARAVHLWRRALKSDPLRESSLRGLMGALEARGEYAAALLAYRSFHERSLQELGAGAGAETEALVKRIRDRALNRSEGSRSTAPEPSRRERWLGAVPQATLPLIGRETEIAQVTDALYRDRMVALTGPGGIGKTRLAEAVANRLDDELPNGVCFVDLGALSEPELVAQEIAHALGLRLEQSGTPESALATGIGERRMLLVLDNCERVAQACVSLMATLVSACPYLLLLATSRHVLDLPAAAHVAVPPLAVPSTVPGGFDEDRLAANESIQLFVDRACRTAPGIEISGRTLRSVAQICARLDGVPLAIELAAARMRGLTADQISHRLDDLLSRLSGPASAATRHGSLHAVIESSFKLLSQTERILLRRLGVFWGSFALEAAEEVCGGDGIDREAVMLLLLDLLDKSLVQYDPCNGDGRYRLLETVRQYARHQLRASDDELSVVERYVAYFADLAELSEEGILGPDEARWLERLERDHDNIRGAMAAATPAGRLRMSGALWRYWHDRNHYDEAIRCLEASIAEGDNNSADYARALYGLAAMLWRRGDLDAAETLLADCESVYRVHGDEAGRARVQNFLGSLAVERGDYARATEMLTDALSRFRSVGYLRGVAFALENLGQASIGMGDLERAIELLNESEHLLKALGCEQTVGGVLNHLALIEARKGRIGAAMDLLRQSVGIHRRFLNKPNLAAASWNLGAVSLIRGDADEARSLFMEALMEWRQAGGSSGIATGLLGMAWIHAQADPLRAALLFGASATLRKSLPWPDLALLQEHHEKTIAAVRAALTTSRFAEAWSDGERLTADEAIHLASIG